MAQMGDQVVVQMVVQVRVQMVVQVVVQKVMLIVKQLEDQVDPILYHDLYLFSAQTYFHLKRLVADQAASAVPFAAHMGLAGFVPYPGTNIDAL